MRLCPTVEGPASPLITHLIGVDVCMSRQRAFYHKCHRCQFRGKAANWEPPVGSVAETAAADAKRQIAASEGAEAGA